MLNAGTRSNNLLISNDLQITNDVKKSESIGFTSFQVVRIGVFRTLFNI